MPFVPSDFEEQGVTSAKVTYLKQVPGKKGHGIGQWDFLTLLRSSRERWVYAVTSFRSCFFVEVLEWGIVLHQYIYSTKVDSSNGECYRTNIRIAIIGVYRDPVQDSMQLYYEGWGF